MKKSMFYGVITGISICILIFVTADLIDILAEEPAPVVEEDVFYIVSDGKCFSYYFNSVLGNECHKTRESAQKSIDSLKGYIAYKKRHEGREWEIVE